jgi:hypothetical protein
MVGLCALEVAAHDFTVPRVIAISASGLEAARAGSLHGFWYKEAPSLGLSEGGSEGEDVVRMYNDRLILPT